MYHQPPQRNLIVNPVAHHVSVSSAARDRDRWPSPSVFQVRLVGPDAVATTGHRIKNVHSVKLISCSVPALPALLDDPYLLLQIDELHACTFDAASTPVRNAFAKVYFEPEPVSAFYRLDDGTGDPLEKVYWPTPLAALDRLTVSFRRPTGEPIDLGADDGMAVDPLKQTFLTLEIREYVPDSKTALGIRSV